MVVVVMVVVGNLQGKKSVKVKEKNFNINKILNYCFVYFRNNVARFTEYAYDVSSVFNFSEINIIYNINVGFD